MDFQKAVELIGKSNKVLITTHTRPDGDACGCIAAISETLTALGKNVQILLLSELPQWYEFLFEWRKPSPSGQKPEIFSPSTPLGRFDRPERLTVEGMVSLSNHKKTTPHLFVSSSQLVDQEGVANRCGADLIIIVDTDAYNQLPEFDKHLKKTDKPILVIDHHATSDNLGDVRLIDNSAAATALIVFDLLKYAGWPITKKIAEVLFVAVSTDTGWFQFDNTDSRTLKVCAELIDAGANPSRLSRNLYQNFSPQRFKLMAAMLNTLQLHLDGRFATQHLTQHDFKRTGAKFSDTENLIDECRRISGVEAAALFVELADGQVKVSLRSMGAIDVCKIAAKFGGGGHKMAAGAYLPGPIENAKKLILTEIAEQFERSERSL
jgi:phosphoesterase RecJ-like protein